MFLKLYIPKRYVLIQNIYRLKNKRKLKIVLFECSKSIRTDEKFSF